VPEIFQKDKYLRALEEFPSRISSGQDPNQFFQNFSDIIEKTLGRTTLYVFLWDPVRDVFHPVRAQSSPIPGENVYPFPGDSPALNPLKKNKRAGLRGELEKEIKNGEEEELSKMMQRLGAEVYLPFAGTQRLMGLSLLGKKRGDQGYGPEDLGFLNFLASQAGLALENAHLQGQLTHALGIIRQTNRWASLGALMASLAHEIRNPLVSIKTFIQLLPERLDDEEFRDYFFKVASGEVDRLNNLLNELVGFVQIPEPAVREEDPNALIEKIRLLVATEARKRGATLSKEYSPNLPRIMVDVAGIKQALMNILLWAIREAAEGGEIGIGTREVQVQRSQGVESFLQIEIRFSRKGMVSEEDGRVTGPSVAISPGGDDMGLAITRQIIQEHGGFSELSREEKRGTSFRVHVPVKTGQRGPNEKR